MKLLSIKEGADFTRFHRTVKVEVQPGLIIGASMFGEKTLSDIIPGKIIAEVNDLCWDRILLFGEEVKSEGFDELFTTLFKKDLKKFKEEVNDTIEEMVNHSFPDNLFNTPKKLLINGLRERLMYVTPHRVVDPNGGLCNIVTDWEIVRLMVFLTKSPMIRYQKLDESGSFRGFAVGTINNIVQGTW